MFKAFHIHDSDARIRRVERELRRLQCIEELRRSSQDVFPTELSLARDVLLRRLGA